MGINLNLEKCSFGVQLRILLSHIMCKEGLLMDPQKIEVNHPWNTKSFILLGHGKLLSTLDQGFCDENEAIKALKHEDR